MQTECISYQDDTTKLEAFVAYPSKEKRPLVVLCHAWRGRDEFICNKAKEIAELGYIGFALDMYGKGILGNSKEENSALKAPFIENREILQRRVLKGYEVATSLPFVEAQQVAVLGFGFGGMCALDLMRSGVNLKGAISVYGHFTPPPSSLIKPIKAKVLILHGYRDSIVTLDEFKSFTKEMDAAKVDWQAHIYGDAMHAFATPAANDLAAGILYNPTAALKANVAISQFLQEIF